MSLKQYSTTLYPHHGDPSPKPLAVSSLAAAMTQVTQRESVIESGFETDLGHPSGERPAAFPTLAEAVERVMVHDRKLHHRVDTFTLKACIDSLQRALAKVEALAAGTRADFERERDCAEQLAAEMLTPTANMAAKEATARLEGELAALRSRPWWKRLRKSPATRRGMGGA